MAKLTTHARRMPVDLSRLVFHSGQIGRLKGIDLTYVHAGDGYSADFVGSFRLSPLRRSLAMDCRLEFFTFYIPMRWIDDDFQQMLLEGPSTSIRMQYQHLTDTPGETWRGNYVATNCNSFGDIPKYMHNAYLAVWNNYFKSPEKIDFDPNPANWNSDDAQFGLKTAHLKSYLTAPIPRDYQSTFNVSVAGETLNVKDLAQGEAMLLSDQQRDLFAQRYRDVVDMLGGDAPLDVDRRPQLLQRTSMWTSGYDVNGSDQASLGQYSGRAQQAFQHTVPRFFCREHGVVLTLAVARLPHVHYDALSYEVGCNDLSYATMIHDPIMAGVGGETDVPLWALYNGGGNDFVAMAHQQWHRVAAPAHVDERYELVDGFPFIGLIPATGNDDVVYIEPHDYDGMFQSDQLSQWNIQCKTNVTCQRYLTTTRDTLVSDDN